MQPRKTYAAHVPAALLKRWCRELKEPLIPSSMYNICVECPSDMLPAVVSRLPPPNLEVICHLVAFLRRMARPEVAAVTKMDVHNLALVFAPSFLRSPAEDPLAAIEKADKEAAFVVTLLAELDVDQCKVCKI